MRKLTKTSLRNKLDKICSQIVRARGYCQTCKSTDNLQTAHIFSRTYNSTRFDTELNLVCLCAKCHWYFHKNPIYFAEWAKEFLGKEKYTLLKARRNEAKKWSLTELQELLNSLKDNAKQ